jgi:hypothetical protein
MPRKTKVPKELSKAVVEKKAVPKEKVEKKKAVPTEKVEKKKAVPKAKLVKKKAVPKDKVEKNKAVPKVARGGIVNYNQAINNTTTESNKTPPSVFTAPIIPFTHTPPSNREEYPIIVGNDINEFNNINKFNTLLEDPIDNDEFFKLLEIENPDKNDVEKELAKIIPGGKKTIKHIRKPKYEKKYRDGSAIARSFLLFSYNFFKMKTIL